MNILRSLLALMVGTVVIVTIAGTVVSQSPRDFAVQAAQPTPMVSVTTLPALPGNISTASPLGSPTPFAPAPGASPLPLISAPPATMSPQEIAAHAIIEVRGDVVKPLTLSLKDLEHMKSTSLTLQLLDPDGRRRFHTFTGVLLSDIINAAQPRFSMDPATLARKYVLVTGVDGENAIVGFPEFVPQFNGKRIILAYLLDLQNLTSPGFAMLAVPEDATRARFLTVARLTVGEPQP